MIPRTLSRNGWTGWHALGALAMLVVGVGLTWEAWTSIWLQAVDGESGYLLLVPFISAWLVWVRQQRIRFCTPTGTWIGPVVVAIGWLLFTWGFNIEPATVSQFGALLIVLGCVLSILGTDILYQFFSAVLVLVFLVPLPDIIAQPIAEPIQAITADVTQAVYGEFGMNVVRDGDDILIGEQLVPMGSTGSVMVVVMSFILMSYAFAFGMPLRSAARAVILGASPILALLCNFGRSLAIAWIYGSFEENQIELVLHASAWIMIGVALLCLFGIIRMLQWASVPIRRFPLAYYS